MTLSITLAQQNWKVGDIEGNCQRIIQIISQNQSSDLIVFSELAICGYPPEDLLFRNDFKQVCESQLSLIKQASQNNTVIVGHPTWVENGAQQAIYNSVSVFSKGQQIALYHKQTLPNYDVFDEKRYFLPDNKNCCFELNGHRIGLLICEDVWHDSVVDGAVSLKPELIIVPNASPYETTKLEHRHNLITRQSSRTKIPFIYLNQIGGQDELIFDGQSFATNTKGEIICQFNAFAEQISQVHFIDSDIKNHSIISSIANGQPAEKLSHIYDALVLAVRDYVYKNGFDGVILGLSGGIDSALTLAIAVDALGKDRVQAIMMPFRYTADISIYDAKEQADILGVEFDVASIEPMFDSFMAQLTPIFASANLSHAGKDTTEENLQARCRAIILMALSNKRRRLVLTTSNKSEVSVGYSTLYGDMAGGFAPLKDVYKTLVYKLANYRNTRSYVIPERVITRPPSAELAPDQKDQDNLPPYDILDPILEAYMEQDASVVDLVKQGFDESVVRKVIKLVDISEYKRRQSAVGPKITARNYGKGRRYPMTSAFGNKNW